MDWIQVAHDKGPTVGSCVHDNVPLDSKKGRVLLEQLKNYSMPSKEQFCFMELVLYSPYLKENTTRNHYKYQSVNAD
jgi:hypothetical protein